MSTTKDKKSSMDIIKASVVTKEEIGRRGPKKHQLPEQLIWELHNEDMGSRAIASKLKREQGIDVSYRTIQRVLSGERS